MPPYYFLQLDLLVFNLIPHWLHWWPVHWLKTAPAAEVLHVAILCGKRAVSQTKLTLKQSRNRDT